MLTIFFSGTGNTKYVAEKFSNEMNAKCLSIEEDIDFAKLISEHDSICVCYPIYGSRVPRIFKEFVEKHKESFKGKKIIILVTQLLYSGDGARSFTDLFQDNYFEVIYAEHINMPNNISNIAFFRIKNGKQNDKKLRKANSKIVTTCKNIKDGKINTRGFNKFSKILGNSQSNGESKMNARGKSSFKTNESCTNCGLCVKNCPMKNLELSSKIEQKDNCTLCYRCINLCPNKSISILFDKNPKKQYNGVAK